MRGVGRYSYNIYLAVSRFEIYVTISGTSHRNYLYALVIKSVNGLFVNVVVYKGTYCLTAFRQKSRVRVQL